MVQFGYYLGVFGTFLAFFLVGRHFWAYLKLHEGLAMLGFVALGLFVQAPGYWAQVHAFGRVMAPLLLLGLQYFSTGDWRKMLPACMVSPGVPIVSAPSASRVVQHLPVG